MYANVGTITIDHTKVPNTDQANFPVLISGTFPYLATTANGGGVTSPSGNDIIFASDSGGTQPLPFEQQSYNPVTGAVTYWVKVPLVSHTTDTVFYVLYGNSSVTTSQANAGAVWSAYAGVWHLGNGATLNTADSTSNGNNGTNHGAGAEAGGINGAASVNGVNEYIDVGSSGALQPAGAMTAGAWIKAGTTQLAFPMLVTDGDSTGVTGYNLYLSSDHAAFILDVGGWGGCFTRGTSSVNDNAWHYVVGTYGGAGGTAKVYVDGVLQGSASCGNQGTNYGTGGEERLAGSRITVQMTISTGG